MAGLTDRKSQTHGLYLALIAAFSWGTMPVYWKAIKRVHPSEILAHRILWSVVFILAVVAAKRGFRAVAELRQKDYLYLLFSSLFIGGNWFLYIWSVNNGYLVECSLGYFINPLINVAIGVIFFRERLTPKQNLAVGLAFAAVLYLTLLYGRPPLIALTLALSFAGYATLRKHTALDPVAALLIENLYLLPPAAFYLLSLYLQGRGALMHETLGFQALLSASGALTALPLICYAAAAKRLPLSTLGVLQYLSPTLQFLLATIAYREDFSLAQLYAFIAIWFALGLYTWDMLFAAKERNENVSAAEGRN